MVKVRGNDGCKDRTGQRKISRTQGGFEDLSALVELIDEFAHRHHQRITVLRDLDHKNALSEIDVCPEETGRLGSSHTGEQNKPHVIPSCIRRKLHNGAVPSRHLVGLYVTRSPPVSVPQA